MSMMIPSLFKVLREPYNQDMLEMYFKISNPRITIKGWYYPIPQDQRRLEFLELYARETGYITFHSAAFFTVDEYPEHMREKEFSFGKQKNKEVEKKQDQPFNDEF